MTPRERIVTALNCQIPDRVPVMEYLFSPKLQQTLLGYTTPLYDGPSQLKLAHQLGLDGMWIGVNGFCGLEEEVHPMGAIFQDEWGGTRSLLMSPRHLREFFIPPFREIVQGLKKLGFPVIMHNDGRIWDMLDDLVDAGINAYHPVERAAGMDLAKVKQRYQARLCPIGNIDNKTTMVTGSPDDVRREALECLKIAAPGGGYILATDHSLHDDIPLENILAYIEVAKVHGTYPLRFASE